MAFFLANFLNDACILGDAEGGGVSKNPARNSSSCYARLVNLWLTLIREQFLTLFKALLAAIEACKRALQSSIFETLRRYFNAYLSVGLRLFSFHGL